MKILLNQANTVFDNFYHNQGIVLRQIKNDLVRETKLCLLILLIFTRQQKTMMNILRYGAPLLDTWRPRLACNQLQTN